MRCEQHPQRSGMQLEKRIGHIDAKHSQALSDIRDDARVAKEQLLAQISEDASHNISAQQSLHEELQNQVSDLTQATHGRVEAVEQSLTSDCRCCLPLLLSSLHGDIVSQPITQCRHPRLQEAPVVPFATPTGHSMHCFCSSALCPVSLQDAAKVDAPWHLHICRRMQKQHTDELRDIMASHASTVEGLQQKHRAVVRHAQALTHEMTQLAHTLQGLDSMRKDQQQQIEQVQTAMRDDKDAHDSRADALSQQIEKMRHSAAVANGCALD